MFYNIAAHSKHHETTVGVSSNGGKKKKKQFTSLVGLGLYYQNLPCFDVTLYYSSRKQQLLLHVFLLKSVQLFRLDSAKCFIRFGQ